jgi:hypothetical protein
VAAQRDHCRVGSVQRDRDNSGEVADRQRGDRGRRGGYRLAYRQGGEHLVGVAGAIDGDARRRAATVRVEAPEAGPLRLDRGMQAEEGLIEDFLHAHLLAAD